MRIQAVSKLEAGRRRESCCRAMRRESRRLGGVHGRHGTRGLKARIGYRQKHQVLQPRMPSVRVSSRRLQNTCYDRARETTGLRITRRIDAPLAASNHRLAKWIEYANSAMSTHAAAAQERA